METFIRKRYYTIFILQLLVYGAVVGTVVEIEVWPAVVIDSTVVVGAIVVDCVCTVIPGVVGEIGVETVVSSVVGTAVVSVVGAVVGVTVDAGGVTATVVESIIRSVVSVIVVAEDCAHR